ncbi:DUF192 domain-containing protein [Halosimplex halophilum]|uniref:DUF192 domain-containing protein n=1 Tax=Halosimplex halophilum TaxID=2559572 RepID=UPI00107FC492|nr:DUF192 domain-containing protein [Halosimplex halophilum]
MRRRAFLAAVAAAGVAGCRSDGTATDGGTDDGGSGPTTSTDGTATPTTEADPTTGTPAATVTGTPTATPTGTPTATASPTPLEPGTREAVFPDYETTDVRVTTPDGERLGSVTAAIADTGGLRFTGLSDTESLPEDWGMLFVYDSVGSHTYVMREMDFGLDIVYADGEGAITEIHHAPEPGPNEDGEDQTYPGRGQYVLEVNKGWTTERGVETGDVLRFEL